MKKLLRSLALLSIPGLLFLSFDALSPPLEDMPLREHGTKALPGPGGVHNSMTVWFKADADVYIDAGITPAANGNPVQQWNEQSGNISIPYVSQSNFTSRPTYYTETFNFNPAIYTDGGNDFIHSPVTSYFSWTSGSQMSAYAVLRHISGSGGTPLTWDDSGGPNKFALGTKRAYYDGSNSNPVTNAITVPNEQARLVSNFVSGGQLSNYLENQLQVSGSIINLNGFGTCPLTFGRLYYHGYPSSSEFSEVVIYDAVHTAADQRRVYSYLAIKYGLTLGTNGTAQDYQASDASLVWSQSSNAGYNYDITGIGRDDDSDLDQRKSRSENHSAGNYRDIMTIANGNLFSSPSDFSADRSFLMWGNDDGNLVNQMADVGMTLNAEDVLERLQRVWKVQESGTIGQVSLQFDLSGVAGIPDLANARLLVDTDATFASGATSIGPDNFNNGTGIVEFIHDFGAGTGFFLTVGVISPPLSAGDFQLQANAGSSGVQLNWHLPADRMIQKIQVKKTNDVTSWALLKQFDAPDLVQSYLDSFPGNGIQIYQIQAIDVNGRQYYSNTVEVQISNAFTCQVFPIPADQFIEILVNTDLRQDVEILLLDLQGRLVQSFNLSSIENQKPIKLEMQQIPNGVYILHVASGEDVSQQKITILH